MKTWQMIKELTEHPEKKFETYSWKHKKSTISLTSDRLLTSLTWDDGLIFEINKTTLEYEWQEIKQSVTWEKAIEAHASDVDIYFILDGERYNVNEYTYRINSIHFRKAIIRGKWYIGDPT